ncbi:MAG TPA: hypothetical protein DEH25_14090 [Chloroflexi bacterium]|nr:hypothetical protein [Chloroflexota bacterium]HBY07430.1 hypothetical protein [Chloroflexota bacterium]
MMQVSNAPLLDQELLQKTAGRDEKAFKQLYQRYQQAVFNYILRLIHDEVAAEELLQDVFFAIWQGAADFRSQASVKTWIFRIAHFQAVSWLRKNLPGKHAQKTELDDELLATEPSPEETLIEKRKIERMLIALENLSPSHRSVVELTFVHGFSQNEIAEILKCPAGTVKSRMSSALKYLAASLENDESK